MPHITRQKLCYIYYEKHKEYTQLRVATKSRHAFVLLYQEHSLTLNTCKDHCTVAGLWYSTLPGLWFLNPLHQSFLITTSVVMLEVGGTEIARGEDWMTGFSHCNEILTLVLITCSPSDGILFITLRPIPGGTNDSYTKLPYEHCRGLDNHISKLTSSVSKYAEFT